LIKQAGIKYESIVFSGLTLLTGLGIIAPWLISVYLEDRNKKLEKEAEEELNKRDLETKAKIENFIQKIQPFIEGFEPSLDNIEFINSKSGKAKKIEIVNRFRTKIFSLLKLENPETQWAVLDILKSIEPKIKEIWRIQNL
jgi:alcohol dehydrogenase YqhD (iron-dependent ADH family)